MGQIGILARVSDEQSRQYCVSDATRRAIVAYESSMLEVFKRITLPNFHAELIQRKEDIWPNFKALLSKERIQQPR